MFANNDRLFPTNALRNPSVDVTQLGMVPGTFLSRSHNQPDLPARLTLAFGIRRSALLITGLKRVES